MRTTIFVPVLTSCAGWIFCNQTEAFSLGLIHAEGKMLSGYHTAGDAIAAYKEKHQPQEPFAVLHLSFLPEMGGALSHGGALCGVGKDEAGRAIWTLTQDGCIALHEHGGYQLLMEIVPVERKGICLY